MIQCLNTDGRGAIIANWPVGIQAGRKFPQKSRRGICNEGAERLAAAEKSEIRNPKPEMAHLRSAFFEFRA
jgi:hypothetical protein